MQKKLFLMISAILFTQCVQAAEINIKYKDNSIATDQTIGSEKTFKTKKALLMSIFILDARNQLTYIANIAKCDHLCDHLNANNISYTIEKSIRFALCASLVYILGKELYKEPYKVKKKQVVT